MVVYLIPLSFRNVRSRLLQRLWFLSRYNFSSSPQIKAGFNFFFFLRHHKCNKLHLIKCIHSLQWNHNGIFYTPLFFPALQLRTSKAHTVKDPFVHPAPALKSSTHQKPFSLFMECKAFCKWMRGDPVDHPPSLHPFTKLLALIEKNAGLLVNGKGAYDHQDSLL